ncbi:MAG: histidine kinase, partial [Bacteroidota bacterium]
YTGDNPYITKLVLLQLVIGGSCLFVSHQARNYIKGKGWIHLSPDKLIGRALLLNLVSAILAQIIIHTIMYTALEWYEISPLDWKSIPFYTFNVFFLFVLWSLIYFAFHYFELSRQSKMEKLQAQSSQREAELIALKAQINPHFLFNSLNNIRALILENPMKARDMVTNLSDLLRYSIQFSNQEMVSVQSEMEIVENYLELESVQYENRLSYQLEIDERTSEKKIPPMVIQLLVENAVKHGISQLPDGGTISVKTSLMDDDLIINVQNTGSLVNNKAGGIGINNAIDRIRMLFAVDPFFDLMEQEGTVLATLKLPAKI